MQPQPEKKKRKARKKTKKPVNIAYNTLRYPTVKDANGQLIYPRTLPEKRISGPYRRLKNTDNMYRNKKTVLTIGHEKLIKTFQNMNVEHAQVTWAVPEKDGHIVAVDQETREPGVAIYFQYMGREKIMCSDRYKCILANLNACMDAIQGIFLLVRSGCETDFSRTLQRYSSSLSLSVSKKETAPSKAHFSYKDNWRTILEIPNEECDDETGLPKNKFYIGDRKRALALKYDPSWHGFCAADKHSWVVICDAAKYVRGCYPDAIERRQNEVKARAAEQAEERRKLREQRETEQKEAEEAAKIREEAEKAKIQAEVQEPKPEPEKPKKNFLNGHDWIEGPNDKASCCKYCGELQSRCDDSEICNERVEMNEADVDDSDIDDSFEDERIIDDSVNQDYEQ